MLEFELPWSCTHVHKTFNVEKTIWRSRRVPTDEFREWMKEHIPVYRINSTSDWACSLMIDENDTEGRALLKLTWGIG